MKAFSRRFSVLAIVMVFSLGFVSSVFAEIPELMDLADKVGPSVVNIKSEGIVNTSSEQFHRMPSPRGRSPFDDFFNQFREKYSNPPARRSLGSGFIVSEDGYILTNNHVVQGSEKVTVTLQNGKKSYQARVVGQDPETDLALIKIDVDYELPALPMGDSGQARVGEWVMAIGNPFGLDHTVTVGIVSAKGRNIGAGPYDNFIQTDASINPGNSGGPLLNLKGEVIGINTAIVASGQGIGFAVPSNMANEVLDELKEHHKVRRGLLGVSIQNIDEDMANALGLDSSQGALVAAVTPEGPAEKAGIKVGDVITELNGKNVSDSHMLTRTIGKMDPEEKVEIKVFRKGDVKTFKVRLAERKTKQIAMNRPAMEENETVLGMTLRPVDESEAESLGLEHTEGMVIVNLDGESEAYKRGIRKGDVLLQINQQDVKSTDEVKKVIENVKENNEFVMLLIQRRGESRFVTIPLARA